MASFVPPESSTFRIEEGGAFAELAGATVASPVGWSLLSRATMVVLDGPGDEGFLLRRCDRLGGDRAPPDWDAAVERHGGAWMLLDDGDRVFAALAKDSA
jgi:hypothetical protein